MTLEPLNVTDGRLHCPLCGKRYGRWTIIKEAPSDPARGRIFICMCKCGQSGEVPRQWLVSKANRKSGNQLSCGCLRRDIESAARTILFDALLGDAIDMVRIEALAAAHRARLEARNAK